MKAKWLQLSLIPGPRMALVTSQEEFDKAMKRLDLPKHESCEWLGDGHWASVMTLTSEQGALACVVSLRLVDDEHAMIASLVHESVHVFQRFCEHIGEHSPSKEFEAYSVEHIFTALFNELAQRLKKEKA